MDIHAAAKHLYDMYQNARWMQNVEADDQNGLLLVYCEYVPNGFGLIAHEGFPLRFIEPIRRRQAGNAKST